MIASLDLILTVLALVLFGVAAFNVPAIPARINLIAAGLFCLTLTLLTR